MRFRRLPRRARLLTLGVAASALLAACLPVAPPPPPVPPYQTQYCAGGTPLRAADYQAQHDGLRTVNTDFGAGDNGIPVDLGDGRTLWMFGDTWAGYIRNGAMVDPYQFVRNAFVVQTGGCLTPLMGGVHGARSDVIPAPSSGQWYWPMSAYVEGSVLYVFVQRYLPGTGVCGCVALDNRIAKFSLPGLTYLGTSPSPAAALLPEFGNSGVTAGAFRYFVGRGDPTGLHRNWHYLARVPVGADPTTTPWEFWNGGTSAADAANWSTDGTSVACNPGLGGACPMSFEMPGAASTTTEGPNAGLWVIPQSGGTFLASAKLEDVDSDPINAWFAPTPSGPWTGRTFVTNTPPPAGGFTYGGRVFQLPGAARTAQYSTNGPDNDHHTDVYKVLFASAP